MRQPPRQRHLKLELSIGADDRDALARQLRDMAERIECEPGFLSANGPGASGGSDHGYSYRLTIDPDMDGERYRRELEQWRVQRQREILDAGPY